MNCVYHVYKNNGLIDTFTYQQLLENVKEKASNMSDIVFSKGTKLDVVLSQIKGLRKEYTVKASQDKLSGEPDYGDKYTSLTFIDSGHFRFLGNRIIPEQNDENFIANAAKAFMDEGLSENEARFKAEGIRNNWQIINEDAKELHKLLNSFNFQVKDKWDFIQHLQGSRFADLAATIYDLIAGDNGLFRLMRGSHKKSNDTTVQVMQNVGLSAKIKNLGDDIIGHIDNLVIDTDGMVHIYNYKMTSTPVSEWNAVKMEKYKYQMALLKQILAYNGVNISGISLHIVPIRVNYSPDFSSILDATVYVSNHLRLPVGQAFTKYDRVAKYFISTNILLDTVEDETILRINKLLQHFFPERNIRLKGILKSIEEWIKYEYSSKVENRIKKVDAVDHTYEVFLDDDFKNPIKIKNPAPPLLNEELKEVLSKHIEEIENTNSEFIDKIVDNIRVSRRAGTSNLSRGKISNRNLQIALSFMGNNLKKYLTSYNEVQGVKLFEWELISNDTLLDAHILLFQNTNTDLIDAVVISNYDLKTKVKFKGRDNIMGSYIPDASPQTKGLINFPSNFANIEAMRAMTILNEMIPLLNLQNLLLGQLKVMSTARNGMEEIYDFESLNRDLFQEAAAVVKYNSPDFSFTNNFPKAKYVDPLTILIQNYQRLISNDALEASEKQEIKDIGFNNLESLTTKEAKKIELLSIIERIFKLDPTILSMNPEAVIDCARYDMNTERRTLANLYLLANDAYCYYSGIQVRNEYRLSKIQEYGFTLNRVPNKTYLGVTNMFIKTIDDIAAKVREEYTHIHKFTMDFYKAKGYGTMNASVIGNQVQAFNNLYRRDDSMNKLMEFRNPYENDSLPPLDNAEKTYLKKVLFELAKLRSLIYGFTFDFDRHDLDNPSLIAFINENRGWYFNVPLERASHATVMNSGFKAERLKWALRAKNYIHNPQAVFRELVLNVGTKEEAELMELSFHTLCFQNPYTRGDGYKGGEASRIEMLNSYEQGYFETNVENILAHYLEKQVQAVEFNKTLIAVKGTLLQLQMIGETAGAENKAGLVLTTKMIQDYIKENMFNISIMEPESLKVMGWLHPFRLLVSKAYIAGNIVSMFRDTFEGIIQNSARTLTKFLTDISVKNLLSAYKEVTAASFTSVRNITIIDALCKMYRLSNLDIARISEGLTTSTGGVFNIDNWMYATLRAPDFLNRMVLFVANCMKDGCWEAFDVKNGAVIYNWKKDKRYSIYADPSKKGTKEWEELRIAYFNAVRKYNQEHPDNTISVTDDLPMPYSNQQVLQLRNLSNSIYGAYDKSMRAKYERTALGLCFATFSTWMNGQISTYFAKPGQYVDGITAVEQEKDGSGNLLFFDKDGRILIQIKEGDNTTYVYEDTGENATDLSGLAPVMKNVPLVVQGIYYTLKDSLQALRAGGLEQVYKEIWSNPILRKNIIKLLTDVLAWSLFTALFKLAIDPAYAEHKKHATEHSIVENAFAEIMYKAGSQAYEGFKGPLAQIQFLGENTNPPIYQLSTKVTTDIFKVAFGDKTLLGLLTGNVAIFRSFSDTYKAEVKKQKIEELSVEKAE